MTLLYEWNSWSVEGGKPYPLFTNRARQTSCSLHSIWQSCEAVRIFYFLNSSTKVNKLSRCVAHRLQAERHQGVTYPKPRWPNPWPPFIGWMTIIFYFMTYRLYLPNLGSLSHPHGLEEAPVVHKSGPGHLPEAGWPYNFLFLVP